MHPFIMLNLTRPIPSLLAVPTMGKHLFQKSTMFRIVKIWDRHSLNLQASFHSHEDVITDLDVSKCNRYLASASKDGKIIVWDWKNCKKLDEFNDHRSNVNNVKFFSLITKCCPDKSEDSIEYVIEEIQILVSCSEDGTIRVYDEISFIEELNKPASSDQ